MSTQAREPENVVFMSTRAREPENVFFMSRCPLYTVYNYIHDSLMRNVRIPFIDSDLL